MQSLFVKLMSSGHPGRDRPDRRREVVQGKYGVNGLHERAALDAHWRSQMQHDATVTAAFDHPLATFRQWLASKPS